MKLIDAHGRLKKMAVPVFRTADVMAYLDIRKEHASNLLARLEDSHHIVRIAFSKLYIHPECALLSWYDFSDPCNYIFHVSGKNACLQDTSGDILYTSY